MNEPGGVKIVLGSELLITGRNQGPAGWPLVWGPALRSGEGLGEPSIPGRCEANSEQPGVGRSSPNKATDAP